MKHNYICTRQAVCILGIVVFLTLITILRILGMLINGFYSSRTPDILPRMPFVCCCKTRNDEAWHYIFRIAQN